MTTRQSRLLTAFAVAGLLCSGTQADIAVTINSASMTNGFMSIFELPENGGGLIFATDWGRSGLSASFASSTQVTMMPNSIGDPGAFWYQNTTGTALDPANPGGPGQRGNKNMEANLYGQFDDELAGQTVTFAGNITGYSLTHAHTAIAYIKDFAPDYSSFNQSVVALDSLGAFSIDLASDAGAGRHIQWGIQMIGENVWVTDLAPFGSVIIAAIPEPASMALFGIFGGVILFIRRRFRS